MPEDQGSLAKLVGARQLYHGVQSLGRVHRIGEYALGSRQERHGGPAAGCGYRVTGSYESVDEVGRRKGSVESEKMCGLRHELVTLRADVALAVCTRHSDDPRTRQPKQLPA